MQWSLIKIIFSLGGSPIVIIVYVRLVCSEILFGSTVMLGNKNSQWGHGGHRNTCHGRGAFQGETILIKLHCFSLICKIIFPVSGSGHPDKYLYETLRPTIETCHNYSKFNCTLT